MYLSHPIMHQHQADDSPRQQGPKTRHRLSQAATQSLVPVKSGSRAANVFVPALKLPGLNFIVAFLTTTPDRESCGKILATMGLLSALLLTFIVQMPATLNYDEAVAADARFGWNGTDWTVDSENAGYATWWRTPLMGSPVTQPPSAQFAQAICLSMFFDASTFISSIILYVFLQLADIEVSKITELMIMSNRSMIFAAELSAIDNFNFSTTTVNNITG